MRDEGTQEGRQGAHRSPASVSAQARRRRDSPVPSFVFVDDERREWEVEPDGGGVARARAKGTREWVPIRLDVEPDRPLLFSDLGVLVMAAPTARLSIGGTVT